MLKHLAAVAILALALPTAALAGDPAVNEARQELKEAKRYHKDVDKLVRKWEKAARKDNDKKLAKREAELKELVRGELARLRDLGVASKRPEPKPLNPDFPDKVLPYIPEKPKLERLRDQLVSLKQLDGTGPKKQRLLEQVSDDVAARYERAEARFVKAKKRA